MAKIVLQDIASGYNLSKINANFQEIASQLNNLVFYRSDTGAEPNALAADQDANNYTLFNLRDAVANQEPVTLSQMNARLASIVASGIDTSANYTVTGDWTFSGGTIDFSTATVIGLSGFDPSADYTITGDWLYQTQSSYERPNGGTAIVVESTEVGQEYRLKWQVALDGITFVPGFSTDPDITDSEFKYNGDNDQWELGSGDGLLLKSVPTLYLEDNAQTGQIPALDRDVGDRLQLGSTGYETQLIGSGGDVQIKGTGANSNSTLVFVGSGNAFLGEIGFDFFNAGNMQLATASGTTYIDVIPGATGAFRYRSREVGRKDVSRTFFSAGTTDGEGEAYYEYTGTGGHTFTINAEPTFDSGHSFIIANNGTGNLTIDPNGDTLNWYDGTAVTTGNRTLAPGGICTILRTTAAAIVISGNGLS